MTITPLLIVGPETVTIFTFFIAYIAAGGLADLATLITPITSRETMNAELKILFIFFDL